MSEEMISDEQVLDWFRAMRNPDTSALIAYDSLQKIAADDFSRFFRLLDNASSGEKKVIFATLCHLEKDVAISHPDSFYLLIREMQQTQDEESRRFYLRHSTGFQDNMERHLPAEMLEWLFHEDANIRYLMARLARYAKSSAAVPHLALLLHDDMDFVQRAAQWALEDIDSPEAQAVLAEWKKWHE